MLSPRKVVLQGKALTTWQVRNPSLGYGRGGLVLDTPLCVCDLIRARAEGSDALDQSVTNPLLMTYSSATTSPWVCPRKSGQVCSGHPISSRSSAPSKQEYIQIHRTNQWNCAAAGKKRGGRERKREQEKKRQ